MYSYVVKGSEDGILGVYTSKRKAQEVAINYVVNGFFDDHPNWSVHNRFPNWNNYTSFEPTDEHGDIRYSSGTAEIERFITNE